jgi:uncharacterized RDD family membrane protein YckC
MTDQRQPEERPTEAEAQKTETVMPLVWMGLGLFVVVAFLAFMVMGPKSILPSPHPIVAPAAAPAKPAT